MTKGDLRKLKEQGKIKSVDDFKPVVEDFEAEI